MFRAPITQKCRVITIICVIAVFALTFTVLRDRARFYPGLHHLNPSAAKDQAGPLVPRKIWQIYLQRTTDGPTVTPKELVDTASWLALNQDYAYTLIGSRGADEFVDMHYSRSPEIVNTYHALRNPGLKTDLLRYLLLYLEGGVYTDIDTYAHKPIDQWVPPEIRSQVRLIVGVEFDRNGGGTWQDIPHYLQFCQWTIAAAPKHRIFPMMVERALSSLEELKEIYRTSLTDLHPTSLEVMNSTGPAAWTDMVFELLQEADPSLESLEDLSGMRQAKLIGDILVLPIDGFGMNQPHSKSTNDGTIPDNAFLEHHFRGSWRQE